jgi:hypothetical protein
MCFFVHSSQFFLFLICFFGVSLAKAASLLKFQDHTQLDRHTHAVGLLLTSDHLLTEAASFTSYNKHKRTTSVS